MALTDGELENMADGPSDPDAIDMENLDFGDEAEDVKASEEESPEVEAKEEETAPEAEAKEGEAEETPGVEAKDGEEAEVKADDHMVPKRRLDQVLARARRAEEQLNKKMQEEAESGKEEKPQEPEVDYDAKFEDLATRIAEAQADGDKEELKKLALEQQGLIREQTKAELARTRQEAVNMTREEIVYTSLLEEVIESNPILDAESDKFDQGLVNDINDLQGYYMDKGLDRASALARALELRYPDAIEPQQKEVNKATTDKTQSLSKKLEAANRQPPDSHQVGDPGSSYGKDVQLDPNKMSWEDWDNLSDNDWDKLLGNNL